MPNGEGFVLGIQTSPNKDGLTATLARAALKGAEEAGARCELLNLRKMEIRACQACDAGWGTCRADGTCTIPDDFAQVRELVDESNGIVFASPVYFGDLSEVAKSFLDRLRRCEVSFRDRSGIRGKPVIGITAAGGSGIGVNSAIRNLERYFKWLRLFTLGTFPVTHRNRSRQEEQLYWAGKKLAQAAGRSDP